MNFYELILTSIGIIIGFLGAILGGIIIEKRKEKRELKEFYSWVALLLETLKEDSGIQMVKDDLTAQTLHYTFNRLWSRIPFSDRNLKVRQLIFDFLKGGEKLEEIKEDKDGKFNKLFKWLEKKLK